MAALAVPLFLTITWKVTAVPEVTPAGKVVKEEIIRSGTEDGGAAATVTVTGGPQLLLSLDSVTTLPVSAQTSKVCVPAVAVQDAATEAMFAGIKLINILAEHVPTRDAAEVVRWARIKGSTVVGPASVGIISPGKGKIGSIGSSTISKVFTKGPIGVVSKSGGMTAEIAVTLTQAKLGQSTVIGIGGDQIIGFDFVDALKLFAKDPETKAVVLFGEVGGTYEEQAADYILKNRFKKPVVAIIAGKFTKDLPQGTVLGHAGTIVARGRGGYDSKTRAFRRAGVPVARTLDEVPDLLRKKLKKK